MTPGDETNDIASAQLRVHQVGEVTNHGSCWQLTYDSCGHTQEFAMEGLEDPARLVRFVQRYLAECLICDLMERTAVEKSDRQADFPLLGN